MNRRPDSEWSFDCSFVYINLNIKLRHYSLISGTGPGLIVTGVYDPRRDYRSVVRPHEISLWKETCFIWKRDVWSPRLIWHKGQEVMKRNDKYVFFYIYFTSRTIQRYLSVDKRLFLSTLVPRIDCCELSRYRFRLDHLLVTRSGEQLFILTEIHNKQFMGLRFGVLRWWYGDRYKKGSFIWQL